MYIELNCVEQEYYNKVIVKDGFCVSFVGSSDNIHIIREMEYRIFRTLLFC